MARPTVGDSQINYLKQLYSRERGLMYIYPVVVHRLVRGLSWLLLFLRTDYSVLISFCGSLFFPFFSWLENLSLNRYLDVHRSIPVRLCPGGPPAADSYYDNSKQCQRA